LWLFADYNEGAIRKTFEKIGKRRASAGFAAWASMDVNLSFGRLQGAEVGSKGGSTV